jgi:hypothetical protein
MAGLIRRIAVCVDETSQGKYRWVLIEQTMEPPQWIEIQAAEKPAERYSEAMASGLLALQALIEDLDVGPREAAAPEASPKRRGRFGFGDLPA